MRDNGTAKKDRIAAPKKGGGEKEPAKRDELQRIPAAIPNGGVLRGISISAALAGRFCLPQMWRGWLLSVARTQGIYLQALPSAKLGHGGDCSAPHPSPADGLALGNLFGCL